jgi:hypothetical protein
MLLVFLVTIRSALGSGLYLADPTIKISDIFLRSPEHLASINFEVQLKSIFIAVSQVEWSLQKYEFPYGPLRFTPPLIFLVTGIFGTVYEMKNQPMSLFQFYSYIDGSLHVLGPQAHPQENSHNCSHNHWFRVCTVQAACSVCCGRSW